jgi:hypothetical protein
LCGQAAWLHDAARHQQRDQYETNEKQVHR